MPPAAGGEVGGASATMNFPTLRAGPPGVPAELSSFATTGVAPLRIGVQVCPPSLDLENAAAGHARIQDAGAGRRGRVEDQRAHVTGRATPPASSSARHRRTRTRRSWTRDTRPDGLPDRR